MATAKVWVPKKGDDKAGASMQGSIKADEADQFSVRNTGSKNQEFKIVTQPSTSAAKVGSLNRFAILDSSKELDIDGDGARNYEPHDIAKNFIKWVSK